MIHYGNENGTLLRIGVFYDGNYFSHVSNYYNYEHPRRSRVSVSGLHRFIVHEISKAEGTAPERCRIVDAHYFRGRLSAVEAQERNALFRERQFDEVLMREGIISHFLPLAAGGEKGIDVWLALEALELAIHKRFDVVVLVAGDGDYLPLVRKLNTLGTRVCVLGWDFEYTDNQGNRRQTRTAQTLLNEANYPILMSTLIDDRARRNDPLVEELFIASAAPRLPRSSERAEKGTVLSVKEGYGFIRPENGGENLFFHYSDLEDIDWNELREGERVCYEAGRNEKGPCAHRVHRCTG
ncbi:NYN domain-containing protein [Hydrogenimonas sp. SS33]|uniref:NYN domain-containing protein n=1 Tax=Hydrogenimonas leucolamina TaxID=2954236 RepID=UPI00336C23F8